MRVCPATGGLQSRQGLQDQGYSIIPPASWPPGLLTTLFKKDLFIDEYVCVCGVLVTMHVPKPTEARRGCGIPCNWSYKMFEPLKVGVGD